MDDIVREELAHIPRGYGVMRNWLRKYYNRRRRHDLAIGDKTKEETLRGCIEEIKKDNPNWHPEYDPIYFKLSNLDNY